ncbi:MAG TPA: NUDIX domain-containing protein [Burkholderiaceae bacterium]
MRLRPSARLLLLDADARVLLFRFVLKNPERAFWATPGGGLEPGETFAQAALRELREETGHVVADVGEPVASRTFAMRLANGEEVLADERLFLLRVPAGPVTREGWTALEREVMAEHRWWSADELRSTRETVWPDDLVHLLVEAGAWTPA